MGDLKDSRLIILKGMLFLFLGAIATLLLAVKTREFQIVLLHLLAVWAFARAYYFAFYVIEHYVDRRFRFAGLFDFASYLLQRAIGRRRKTSNEATPDRPATTDWKKP